jgi:hypothetical protein
MASHFVFTCALGVFATAALVVSNKHMMERYGFSGAAALLTFLHAASTAVSVRIGYCCSKPVMPRTSWPWLFVINLLGSLSIFSSNYLLKLSSVAFHQASRLMGLPLGALIDYFVNGKVRTASQYFGLALISYGVLLGSSNATVSNQSIPVAAVFNVCWVFVATLIKHVCHRDGLSSADFLYLSAPWSIATSVIWLGFSEFQWASVSVWWRNSGISWPAFAVDIVLNLALAFSVNFLSTWAQRNCSSLLYAVMSQVKTASTVAMGAALFRTTMTYAEMSGLGVSLTVACALAIDEEGKIARTQQNKCRLKFFTDSLLILALMILFAYHFNVLDVVPMNGLRISSRNQTSQIFGTFERPRRRVCVIDAGITHVDLLMNCYLSLQHQRSTCDEFRFLCYDAAIDSMLQSYGFQTLYNATLVEQANRIMTTKSGCPQYLMIPMYLKSHAFFNLSAQHDIDVLMSGADTFFLQNPFDFFKDGMMVSASPPSSQSTYGHERDGPGMWYYQHGLDGSSMTLNNGVLCFTGSSVTGNWSLDLKTHHFLSNLCRLGWYLTFFNSFVRFNFKLNFMRKSTHPGIWTTSLSDGRDFVVFSNVLSQDDKTPVNPILVHADCSNCNHSIVPLRIAWLDTNRAWVLRSDWRFQAAQAVKSGLRPTSQRFADLVTNATKLRSSLLCKGPQFDGTCEETDWRFQTTQPPTSDVRPRVANLLKYALDLANLIADRRAASV